MIKPRFIMCVRTTLKVESGLLFAATTLWSPSGSRRGKAVELSEYTKIKSHACADDFRHLIRWLFFGSGHCIFGIDHQSHHGSENPHHTNSEHQTSIQEALPPNCLFCLDGLPPAPTNLYSHLIPKCNLQRTEFSTQITRFDNVHPSSQHQPRAPPILVWL